MLYQIRIQGELDNNWFGRFSDMEILFEKDDQKTNVTTLLGNVVDQAALFGILDLIRDLNLTLISVVNLEG